MISNSHFCTVLCTSSSSFGNIFLSLLSSCEFVGTQDELEEHLKLCKFESMKEFLQRTDEKMADLYFSLSQKDQEIEFLRSMLGKLSEKLETLEKSVDFKLGTLNFKFSFLIQFQFEQNMV